MSSFKFKVGEPRKVELSFDEPKVGTNDYGMWYLYGIKSEISSDEDSFFATLTLHTMNQTLGAKEGDELTIEKCVDGDKLFYKVNGLSMNDMSKGGSFEKIEKAKPTTQKASVESNFEIRIEKLEERVSILEGDFDDKHKTTAEVEAQVNANDIPF